MKKIVLLIGSLVLCLSCSLSAPAQSGRSSEKKGLTTETVLSLLEEGVSADSVLRVVQQNPTNFVMSLQKIHSLEQAGASEALIDAMLQAGQRSGAATGAPGSVRPAPSPLAGASNPLQVGNSSMPALPGALPSPNVAPGAPPLPAAPNARTPSPSVDLGKLHQARQTEIAPVAFSKQLNEECSLPKLKPRKVDVDFSTGSSSASRLTGTGSYCFRVSQLNPLFDWSIALNVVEPTGNPLDLLNDAITALKSLSTGAAAQAKAAPNPNPTCKVPDFLGPANTSAGKLQQALAGLAPPRDSNGKYQYVPLAVTQHAWVDVQTTFVDFQQKAIALQNALPADEDASECATDQLTQAIQILVETYPTVSKNYTALGTKLSGPIVRVQQRDLQATDTADLVVTPSYQGTALDAKTFHFGPSFGILSASAGFLMTQVPAPTYSSATAPDPADPTKTQNVLQVNYGAGIRPALIAMLTGNIPQLNTRNFGLGVSSGLVFDIASGKADTSTFGYFGGLSLRLTPWIYVTPGVHVGQYANWPPGFTHAGQVIPPNTGTPNPTKQYTARFAFAVTYIIKNLGETSAQPKASSPAK